MVTNKNEADIYIQSIWYRSNFDPALAEIALGYIDDPQIINHIQSKIEKLNHQRDEEARKIDYHKRGRYFIKKHRALILKTLKERDGDLCVRCRRTFPEYQIDHIVPLKKFGHPESIDNLQLMCEKCNKVLGDRDKKPLTNNI